MSVATGPTPEVRISEPPARTLERDGHRHLVGSRCTDCGTLSYPYRSTCSGCRQDRTVPYELSRTGRIYSHTTIHVGPDTPRTMAYVDLDDGVRILARVRADAAIDRAVVFVDVDGEAPIVEVAP